MASKGQVESWTDEVICPICLDFFTDPVILDCGHNFCRSCITRCWEREERNSCPECREESGNRTLKVNRALANLSEKARKLNLNPKEKESKLHCKEHEEELKLFCENDKKLICVICVASQEHREHRFQTIKEAADVYRDRVKSAVESLTEKKSELEEIERQQKEKISGVREQSRSVQSHITSQFAELRRIITEKEQHTLRDLREEEERILNPLENNLREIQENLDSIQQEISKLQKQMDQQENVIFLMEEACRERRISDDVHELSVTDGALPVERFYHPYLLKTALRETLDAVIQGTERSFPDTSAPLEDNRGTAGVQRLPERIPNQEVPGVKMASKAQVESWTDEVICPICLDFFTDPVILDCGHNFCRSCITRCWERNSCPECREEFADRTLRANRALANLSEKARKLNLNPKGKESKPHCEKHEEELKLFCENDKKLLCLICRDTREHREHRFLPIEEAVEVYRDRVKSALDSLTEKESELEEMERQQKEKISGVREQSHILQSHITSQFAELRRIITEKEQHTLRDLKEEEERILNPMEKNLREIEENLNSIQQKISKLQEQMDQQENLIFLMEEACRKRRISDDFQELSVTDGALPVERFQHHYLLKTALRETLDVVNQVSVTLDVETVHPALEVSEDRKSVRWTWTRRNLPDTGKRFTVSRCVLGSEGFTSGRHYWEVEVTGNRWWDLGVAAESVERKTRVTPSPETGFWSIARRDDEMWILTRPEDRLFAGPIPGRVGVYLSYESGTVSFYNAETKSHLHTFTGSEFTGKLYPLFWTWDENQWLRICSGSAPGL
ncbi:E3 ubiquitin-protein ligase TRIM39-like [Mobula hypostoma]|uniref:E3 ubiquitin-protein ligase TRIM39-like n=1 Tax=Mobula hypostoma TaxID=723540 RepID=UPI002FC342C5